ncbi:MAG TPA: hypothetical protein VMW75_23035 [Thermoanaerobaculia bacterium]|nr:hypothetical protein [Thermoanaerobaculia bacterium]
MNTKGTRLVFALVLLSGVGLSREALADASGCSREFSLGSPSTASDGTPNCAPTGDGCYECAYVHQRLSGYDICAEPADSASEGGPICVLDVPNIPNWWPDPVAGTSPPDPPPPGDGNPSGTGDDGGTVDPGGGGGDAGGGGGPYYYAAYQPPAYLYPAPPHRPYNPFVP